MEDEARRREPADGSQGRRRLQGHDRLTEKTMSAPFTTRHIGPGRTTNAPCWRPRRTVAGNADRPGGAEVDTAGSPARPAGRGIGGRGARRTVGHDGGEHRAQELHRRRLPWRPRTAGHPAQPVRKPRLVHSLYALSVGNQPGTPGTAVQLPDARDRIDRPAGCLRVASRRGDGGRRGRRHRVAASSGEAQWRRARGRLASASARCRRNARRAAGNSRSAMMRSGEIPPPSSFPGRIPMASTAIMVLRSRRHTLPARWSLSSPIRSP